MESFEQLSSAYESLRAEAERLAGGLNDLAQRASVYYHLYEDSGRNHIFPLIAAHGAMWARGYFRFGMGLGRCCSWISSLSSAKRKQHLQQLDAFADAFRDINRRVCIETYSSYHFTARFGDHPQADQLIPRDLLDVLNQCHAARRDSRELSDLEKRQVFEAFFRNEQKTIVESSILAAKEAFRWPLMKFIALRPLLRFAYFPRFQFFRFRNFSNQSERIEKGLTAFDVAASVGWRHVESSMRSYAILPESFFANSLRHFTDVRESVLAGT